MCGYQQADIDAAVISLDNQLEKVRAAVHTQDFSKARGNPRVARRMLTCQPSGWCAEFNFSIK